MKKFTIILNLIFSKGKILAVFLAALCSLGATKIAAQGVPVPTPLPKAKPDKTDKKTSPTIVTIPNPRPLPTPPPSSKRIVVNESETPAEKSIVTESKVSINLCVQEGNVRINGVAAKEFTDWRSVSYLFQEDRLLPWRTAQRNVEFALEAGSMPRAERRSRARAGCRSGLK